MNIDHHDRVTREKVKSGFRWVDINGSYPFQSSSYVNRDFLNFTESDLVDYNNVHKNNNAFIVSQYMSALRDSTKIGKKKRINWYKQASKCMRISLHKTNETMRFKKFTPKDKSTKE